MKMKRMLAAVAASALLALSAGALAGCADNSEEVIRESLSEEIDQLKNPDEATLSELSSSMPASTLAQVGLTPDELINALLDGFDGTVDSVTVNGNTAEAVLTLSSKNFDEVQTALMDLQSNMMDNAEELQSMSADEIKTWAGQQIMTTIQDSPVETHDPITVTYERNGNTWEPAAGAESEIYGALFG